MEEYREKVAQRDLPDEIPSSGHSIELPSICRQGKWQAEWQVEKGAEGKKDKLSGFRLRLRHTDHLDMGSLSSTSSSGDIAVSCMFPAEKRSPELLGHEGSGHADTFIGTICLVGCNGFDSAMVDNLLEHVESGVADNDLDASGNNGGERPAIYAVRESDTEDNVGVSIPCALQFDSKYHLRYAQDQSLENNPIVAVDGKIGIFMLCQTRKVCTFSNFHVVRSKKSFSMSLSQNCRLHLLQRKPACHKRMRSCRSNAQNPWLSHSRRKLHETARRKNEQH